MRERAENVVGLWCRSDNTFYFLESGPIVVTNTVDRLKKVLVARSIIKFDITGTRLHEEPYKMMTKKEALEKKFEIKPIYINAHVKKIMEQKAESTSTASPWGKDV